MPQHDFICDNAAGAVVRADLNAAFAAIVAHNSGPTAPTTTYAYMSWADTTAGQMKIRNGANSAWVVIGTLDAVAFGSPLVGSANIFTVGGQTIRDTDAGAAAIAGLALDRLSASPAASDFLEALDFTGRNTSAATKIFARALAQIIDATAGTEDGVLAMWAMIAGTLTQIAGFGNGMVVGAPTGGYLGPGTINVDSGVFIDNVAIGGGAAAATQAEMEAASSTTAFNSPGRSKYSPSATKAFVHSFNNSGVPSVTVSLNVSSMTDNGQGIQTINFSTSFSGVDYGGGGYARGLNDNNAMTLMSSTNTNPAGGSIRVVLIQEGASGPNDTDFSINFNGDF